jgi:hypothetical protein
MPMKLRVKDGLHDILKCGEDCKESLEKGLSSKFWRFLQDY